MSPYSGDTSHLPFGTDLRLRGLCERDVVIQYAERMRYWESLTADGTGLLKLVQAKSHRLGRKMEFEKLKWSALILLIAVIASRDHVHILRPADRGMTDLEVAAPKNSSTWEDRQLVTAFMQASQISVDAVDDGVHELATHL